MRSNCHWYAPCCDACRRCARAAAISSSGQRARGATSSGSVRPSASRSAPAQAIMAPLSVHSSQRRRHQHGAGSRRRRAAAPCGSPGWRRRRRRRPARSARRSARGTSASRRAAGRSTTSTTACWNEAQRSATSWSDKRRDRLGLQPQRGLQPGQREIRLLAVAASAAAARSAWRSPRAASFSTCGPPG